MNAIKVLSQTADTVTISRADLEALLRAAEDAEDAASVDAARAHVAAVGWDAAKAGYLNGDDTRKLLEGKHPITVWREKRGLTQRELGQLAGVAAGYLSEIEARKKPGSVNAIVGLAKALGANVDDLVEKSVAETVAGGATSQV